MTYKRSYANYDVFPLSFSDNANAKIGIQIAPRKVVIKSLVTP